jgi:hypothetical protein
MLYRDEKALDGIASPTTAAWNPGACCGGADFGADRNRTRAGAREGTGTATTQW